MLDAWYVTGLAEGQASFTFSRSGRNFGLYFGIKLTGADEALLHALHAFFQVGAVYQVKPAAPRTARQGHTKAASYYRVTRLEELARVVDHFDQFPLQGRKQESYRIWRRMIRLKAENYRRPPLDELAALARELSAASPRNQREELST